MGIWLSAFLSPLNTFALCRRGRRAKERPRPTFPSLSTMRLNALQQLVLQMVLLRRNR